MRYTTRLLAASCILAWSSPGKAQASDCPADGQNARTHAGIGAATDGRPWFQIEIAPEIVSQNPLQRDSATTDTTAVSWTVGITRRVSCGISLELTAGPSADLDSDDDAEDGSSLSAGATLEFDGLLFGASPFVSYSYERSYGGFFDRREGDEHAFELGISAERRGRLTLAGEVTSRWVESTEERSDYLAARVAPELDFRLVRGVTSLHADAEAERRWYQDVEPTILAERRDWHFSAFAGFQFAPIVNRLLGFPPGDGEDDEGSIIQDALVGVRWNRVNSNVDENDEREFKFAPAISLRVGF